MLSISRTLRYLVVVATLPALTTLTPDAAAATRKGRPASARPKAPLVNNSIIPLPLTPIIPATQRSCASRTPSGLGYTVLRPGAGAKPATTDTAMINYIGYLAATGAVFDQNTQAPLPVDQVIPGFSEGLQMLGKGEVIRLCIPAALGYGAKATGQIPANADLVFQVELLDFRKTADEDAASK